MEISFMGFQWFLKRIWLFQVSQSRSRMYRICKMLSNGVEDGSIEQRMLANAVAHKFGYPEFIVETKDGDGK
tara:strand:- start:425 stop:640 length:216 start_codon:yes stop_codon:yes gene_type:complete